MKSLVLWRIAILVVAAFSSATAMAQDAKVRASLSSSEPLWVGQKVTVVVELLAPGIFSGPVNFDLPDPSSVLLMPPDEHPVVGNETIDGITYTVQRHELSAYPMKSGSQQIPSLKARFAFKRNPLDTDEVPVSVQTPVLPYSVGTPPEAEHLGLVISARDLEVEESWKPQPGQANITAGSAFTREITFTAADIPGMVFPAFPVEQIDGVGIYPKTEIHDESERGSLTGERRERITYVFERPGRFVIPSARFSWFDLDTGTLQTKNFPARTFTVIANPAEASVHGSPEAATSQHSFTWPMIVAGVGISLLLLGVAWNARVRQAVVQCFARFRPVHLRSLNP